ncbi:MAG TPA: PQQ-binding-like beta-propeller repeat protein [Actinomycetota bacterium]|nr:PQQ-binding-like beta-propeller repeat protein [Actinomycetota bacterium]
MPAPQAGALAAPLTALVLPAGSGPGEVSAPAVVDGSAVATAAKSFVRFDPLTGDVTWEVGRAPGFTDPPAIDPTAGAHGVVVATEGTTSHFPGVVGLDLATGAPLWRVGVPDVARGSPIISGDVAYVGVDDGSVYAIGVSDGVVRWRARTRGSVFASPAAAGGKVFAVGEETAVSRSTLYALDGATGKIDWTYSPSGPSAHASAPTVAGGLVYEGFGDGTVRAVGAADGTLRWTGVVRSVFSDRSSPAVGGGSVFVQDVDGGVYRFDAGTGSRLWDYQFAPTSLRAAPLIAGQDVYVGLDDGTLAALDVRSGDLVWRTRLAEGALGSLAPDGDVLLAEPAAAGGELVALRHDPSGTLVRIESPTKLRLPAALEHYGVAFVLVFAGVFGLFRFVVRPRRSESLGGPVGLQMAGERSADEDAGGEAADPGAGSRDEGEEP